MRGALNTPGPANQNSVPGPAQRAATLPSVLCSASSPRAIDPLAWITTPPCCGTAVTTWLGAGLGVSGALPFGPLVLAGVVLPCVVLCGFLALAGAGMPRTLVSDSTPGW